MTIFRFRTQLVRQGKKNSHRFSKVISYSIQETFKHMCNLENKFFLGLNFWKFLANLLSRNIVV